MEGMTYNMTRVLLVEDDPQILKSLSVNLKYGGYEVSTAESVEQAWQRFSGAAFDAILLDVNLPDGTGLDLCRRIRNAGSETPILFLSARTDEETVVEGMNIGGDDYLRKPFGMEELKVRMNKLIKKTAPRKNILIAGTLTMDLNKRLVLIGETALSLGRREFDILSILVRKPGDVITRENILSQLEEKSELYDRTIDSHMSHLRKKIRDVAGNKIRIGSVYGVGYRLEWDN